MPTAVGGEAVIPAIRWGWLSSTTVVASVWPPTHRDRLALEWEVVSRSNSLSQREGWEQAATEWMSTMTIKLKTKNGGKNKKITVPPTWRAKCRSAFFVGKGFLVSWSLAMDENGEHEDLCSSSRWNVIPYVHGRMELYCSSLALPM
jgi:hypothetical protein